MSLPPDFDWWTTKKHQQINWLCIMSLAREFTDWLLVLPPFCWTPFYYTGDYKKIILRQIQIDGVFYIFSFLIITVVFLYQPWVQL